jgi:phosphohistidine phosphatase SixA
LLAVLHDLPDTATTALLIGHNPGTQDLVALLTGQHPRQAMAHPACRTGGAGAETGIVCVRLP